MAATRINTQTITRDGLNPTFETANTDGHTFVCGPNVWLEIINAGGGSVTVLMGQRPDEWTRKASASNTLISVAVPAGQRRRIGPITAPRFDTSPDAAGVAGFGFFSTPTGLTVAVFDLGPLT